MPKTTRIKPDAPARAAREALKAAKEPKSLPELWEIVRLLARAIGIEMENIRRDDESA